MKFIRIFLLMTMIVCAGSRLVSAESRDYGQLVIWDDKPAGEWSSAFPVGNGRLGAMVYGLVATERIQLNEDTLWAGGPYDPANPEALKVLPKARAMIFEGRYKEAENFINENMMAKPVRQMPYQTVGELVLKVEGAGNHGAYRRMLDLDTAIATVKYSIDGVNYTREVFSSPVDQVIVVHLAADKPGRISFAAALTTPQSATVNTRGGDTLVMDGRNGAFGGIAGALKFQALVRVRAEGGQTIAQGDSVSVSGADSATILVSAATSYKNYNDVSGDPAARAGADLDGAWARAYLDLRKDHVAEHQRLFRRVRLDLGGQPAPDLPVEQRLKLFAEGKDPQLAALFFQFGRYLLISSSRPGTQPATLQGIWNEKMLPPWESKYTININTEMNYWIAEAGNLAECAEPLIRMVEEIAQTGRRTAEAMWGAGGWVCHHNTDLWRATAPIDAAWWGYWPCGGVWLTQHLWYHYEYSGDRRFLERIYPVLKGAAQFFLDSLVEEPKHGWLVTCPSHSPENTHPGNAKICAGPAIDLQLLRDLFDEYMQASVLLGIDVEFRAKVAATRERLAPLQVGSAGQLQEWLEDWDLQAPSIHFGHMSHLYGLYPSWLITEKKTPELYAAARKSLEIRGPMGGGWPAAWQVNLWARLKDADQAYRQLTALLNPKHTAPSMVVSPGHYQLDSTFGGAAGILEMLLQSGNGELYLLPALPAQWPDGQVEGLCAKGGLTVDVCWQNGRLSKAVITAADNVAERKLSVIYNGRKYIMKPAPGRSETLKESDFN